jgi:hypothetical protein
MFRFLPLVLFASALFAADVRVAPDSPGGVQAALDGARPGDRILLSAGVYALQAPLRVTVDGEPGRPVTLAVEPGADVWIDGSAYLAKLPEGGLPRGWHESGLVEVRGRRHVRLLGLQVRRSHVAGIYVSKSEDIEIAHCLVRETYNSGIGVWYSRNVRVLRNEVLHCNDQALRPEGVPRRREAPHEAVSIAGTTDFEAAWNRVHRNIKEGIDCKEFSARGSIHHNLAEWNERQGIYLDCWFGVLEDVDVHSNVSRHNDWGIAVSGEGDGASMRRIRIVNNLVHGNRHSGIFFATFGNDRPRTDLLVAHNTVVGNGSPGHWGGISGGIDVRSRAVERLRIVNNLVVGNWGFEIGGFAEPAGDAELEHRAIVVEDNLVDRVHLRDEPPRFFAVPARVFPDRSGWVAEPRFVDALRGDFRLQVDSPARRRTTVVPGLEAHENLGADVEALAGVLGAGR